MRYDICKSIELEKIIRLYNCIEQVSVMHVFFVKKKYGCGLRSLFVVFVSYALIGHRNGISFVSTESCYIYREILKHSLSLGILN